MRRALALAAALTGLLPAAARACAPDTPPDPDVPAWRAVNGAALGSRAATPLELDRYVRAVDRASNRVRTFVAGRSVQGRVLRVAVISSPRNLARLNRLAGRLRAVRSGAAPPGSVRGQPAFVWLAASVHGNEPSGGDADMRILAELAAGRRCADLALLRRLVVFVMADQNPDGRAAGTRANAQRFDLNRDWFARTQPETAAKIAALERFPPMVLADQHEQGGTGFFFPPNADPVHHEISGQALGAINRIVAPRLRQAFAGRDLPFTNYATYDLFFMGYGDTVASTLYGAAGMTFEKGGAAPYAARTREQHLAADATLRAAAARRADLVTGWAAQWRRARAQGARGRLQPNRVLQPGNSVRFAVPAGAVHGYLLRADLHDADARALVDRLVSVGVRVRQLERETAVAGFRGYGEPAAGTVVFPAGTYYVPLRQAAKHWVQALLGEDPHVPFPYFYDVGSWSNPLLMGLSGGGLSEPLAAGTVELAPAPGEAETFAGGSQRAAERAFALLAEGREVRRTADGGFTTGPTGTPLRRPRVALLAEPEPDSPGGWAAWLLRSRYRLAAPALTGAEIASGALGGFDALVVADGAISSAELPPGALAALAVWVRAGGTLVGWRSRGLAVARAAGVTAVREVPAPSGFQVPGVAVRLALDPSDPTALGEEREGFAFNAGDPILAANGAQVVARYPTGERFFVSGHASGMQALAGTPAITTETVGGGRVVLFAFDPVFRGYAEGTERLVANALLAPPAPAATRRAAPRSIDPSALAAPPAGRDASVRVPGGDEAALVAAARAAGVPGFVVERDLASVTLRVRDAGEEAPWKRRLPAALEAAGVTVLLAVL